MKIFVFILIVFFSLPANAQATKLAFNYDPSGNQIKRDLICVNCRQTESSKSGLNDKKETAAVAAGSPEALSYYPNPVKEQLNIKWTTTDSFVTSIQVYSLSGQVLKNYQVSQTENTKVLSFQEYASGIYNVLLTYSNGENKTIKIIKQ